MQEQLTSASLELLGFAKPRQVHSSPLVDIFIATRNTGLEDQDFQFVYIKSKTTRSDLGQIPAEERLTTYFVAPQSSPVREIDINSAFKFGPHKLYRLQDLLWNRMKNAFSTYCETLRDRLVVEPNFVQPRTQDPNSRPDFDVNSFLVSKSEKYSPGTVLALRAPAAVGKTTLCRIIVKKILHDIDASRCIPVFIESSHWSKIRLESINDLWEVVRNSLLSIAPDINVGKSMFEAALRAGLIVFVFDGLDELCGHRNAVLSAEDVVDELANLAQGSNARILVSTRTAYWDAEIEKSRPNVLKLDLVPFNKQQALKYFEQRFSNDISKNKRSRALYEKITAAANAPATNGARSQFANLPACVALIADLVDQDPDRQFEISASPQQLVHDLLLLLCDRDKNRKKLRTPGELQLLAFSQLAASNYNNLSYSVNLLGATGFDQIDVDQIHDHPLLKVKNGEFDFAYEFLDPYFKAQFLEGWLKDPKSAIIDDALELMAFNSNGKSSIIEHLAGLCTEISLEDISKFAKITDWKGNNSAKSFLLHFGLAIADQNKASHIERTAFIAQFSGEKPNTIENIKFIGTFSRLDLRGYLLQNCTFSDCSLIDISIDDTTTIKHCQFQGDISIDTKYWKRAVAEKNHADTLAAIVCGFLLDDKASRNREILLDAFSIALQKFWHNGTPKISIDKNNWKRGLLGASPWCDLILNAFLKTGVIQEIDISGTESGGYAIEASMLPEVQRFIDSRAAIGGKLSEAFSMCIDKMNGS